MLKKSLILLSAIALIAGMQTWRYDWNHDGDSVTVSQQGREKVKVRLLWIDAPELSQPMGEESKYYLQNILKKNKNILIIGDKKDRYGRLLGELYTQDGKSINKQMVRAGMAYFYRKYCLASNDCNYKEWNDLEYEAKKNKRGVWKHNLVKPWVYRKQQRNNQ